MTAAPLATVPPACWSPHPSLARLTPPDRSGVGARIVLLRFDGACAGPTVLSAVGTRPPHDGSSSEPAFQCGSRGPRAAATKSTEWPNPRPGRDASTRPKGGREPTRGSSHAGPPTPVPTTSGRRVRRRVEGRSRLQHRVHDHRQLARDRDRGALEADLLLQLEAPAPQRAVRAGAGQDRGRRLVDQRPEVPVAPPRDVAVVVGLARLVPACRQAEPSPHRARRPEVLRRLDRRHERGRRDGADARDRHEPPAGRARPRRGDQLPVELGRPGAHRASSSGSTTRATASFVPSRARAWASKTRPAPFGTIRPKVFMTPRIWLESWIEMRSSWPRAPTSVRASIGAYPLTRTSR